MHTFIFVSWKISHNGIVKYWVRRKSWHDCNILLQLNNQILLLLEPLIIQASACLIHYFYFKKMQPVISSKNFQRLFVMQHETDVPIFYISVHYYNYMFYDVLKDWLPIFKVTEYQTHFDQFYMLCFFSTITILQYIFH